VSEAILVAAAVLGVLAAAAGLALPAGRRVSAAAGLTLLACVAAGWTGAQVLVSGEPIQLHSALILPLTGVQLEVGPLGALFMVVTAAVGIGATIYGVGYASHGLGGRTAAAALPIFITSMLLVPAAGSVATFVVVWELMAISSLVLVLVEHRNRAATRSAAQWYGVMTHIGAGAILLALVLLAAHAGGQSFTTIRAHTAHLSRPVRTIVFLLALVGFGSKAGAVPLHVWLPKAHPEAPGPVSALMSGAMVNLGLYGILLVGDELLGGGPGWWWLVVLGVGVLSALFGALHAVAASDLKVLLAYSTTDTVGLMLIGIGAAGVFAAAAHTDAAAVAMMAALLLLVNHAAFKPLLFLTAASIQRASRSRDLDQLGGLMRRLPVTGPLFLVGALAIAAVPPLNGFVGEWLLFQSLLHGLANATLAIALAVPIAVAALALTAGLTAATVVKAVGIGLLGQPRSTGAAGAREVALSMRVGPGLLAGACVILGIAPMAVLGALQPVAATLVSATPIQILRPGVGLKLAGIPAAIYPAWLAVGILAAVLSLAWGRRALGRRGGPRPVPAWGGGTVTPTPRMAYTATSFAEPLRRVFDDVLRPDQDLDVSHVAESRYVVESIAYRTRVTDAIESQLYRPLLGAVTWWGERARRVQNGSVHRYLAFGFVALIVVLLVAG